MLLLAATYVAADGGAPSAVWLGLIGFAGVAFTALVTYFVAKRVNSGGVETSTAENLWNESNAMRQELSDRLAKAEEKVERQDKEISLARGEALAARNEALQWQQKAATMESDLEQMKKQIATLQRQVRAGRSKR